MSCCLCRYHCLLSGFPVISGIPVGYVIGTPQSKSAPECKLSYPADSSTDMYICGGPWLHTPSPTPIFTGRDCYFQERLDLNMQGHYEGVHRSMVVVIVLYVFYFRCEIFFSVVAPRKNSCTSVFRCNEKMRRNKRDQRKKVRNSSSTVPKTRNAR